MTGLTKEEHRYVYVQSAVGAAVVNLLLNGLIGWGTTRGMTEFPVFRTPGVAPDLVATAFGVGFGTCFGVLLQVGGDLKRNKITLPSVTPRLEARLARLPKVLWVRALLVGLVCMLVFAPPVCAALYLGAPPALSLTAFIVLKGLFAALEAALITPFLVLAALRDRRVSSAEPAASSS